MEHLTSFISSRGILKSCDCHNQSPISSNSMLDADLVVNHRPGGSIYVCTDALSKFAYDVLPNIQVPFVLVTGDSDAPITDTLLAEPLMSSLLSSKNLISWYAQNLTARNTKLHPLPIGLDYHTMWERRGVWGISTMSSIAQENCLINTLAASPEFNQRYLAAYCNWHFAIHRGDRQECFEKLDKNLCYFEPSSVPRNSTWMRQAQFMFVVSPEGEGMDCHRTWEAIFLGCVPIVKRGGLSDLFNSLPVMQVNNWSEVSQERLFDFFQMLINHKFDFSPLFREYWHSRISGRRWISLPPMTFKDFRRYVTSNTG